MATLTINDEVRGSKTVARIQLTDPRTGKRGNRRWDTRAEAETFVASVELVGLEQALIFDESRRGNAAPANTGKAGSAARFGDYASDYIGRRRTTKGRRAISPDTLKAYGVRLAVVNRTPLALTPLRDITADHLEAFIQALPTAGINGKALSEGYQRSVLAFAATVLGDAFKRGDIPGDPSQNVEGLAESDETAVVILTPADFAAITAQLSPEEALFYSFLLQSGCRYGEATALKWSELEVDESDPSVTLVHIGKGKTLSAKRTTSIPTELAEKLTRHDGPLVFPEPAEGHYRRIWRKACNNAQMPTRAKEGHIVTAINPRPHDLRHTHAVLMLTEGHMNIIALAARLGHSSPQTTAKFYAHFAKPQVVSLGAVAARAARGFM